MWRMILRLDAENQFLGTLALLHNVSFSGYPLSYWKDKKSLYVIVAGTARGEEKNIDLLFRELKKRPEVLTIERSKDFAILITKQPLYSEPVYNPKIIRPNPVQIHKEGHHLWDLASFDRSALTNVWSFAKKHLNATLLTLREEKISNISVTRLLPELTEKQKAAMSLAVEHGYYEYPKKINMERLAKIMKISYSTYQAHLKKAESKIIPGAYAR